MARLGEILKPFRGTGTDVDPEHSPSMKRIESVLGHLPPERAGILAAFALLLGRVAHSDDHLSDKERDRLREILAKDLELAPEQAGAVAELALEREAVFGSDHHLVLGRVREGTSSEERFKLVRALFHLASVDDISEQESEEIRRIVTGLGINQQNFIALRSEFREFLSILKIK